MLLNTPLCDFGWNAPDFTLRDPDGQEYTCWEQIGEHGLLIAFICNHCPYVKAIADRLAEDAKVLKSEGINVLAVMSNDYQITPGDSPPNMKLFAQSHRFDFPYLIDEDQSVGKAYNAVCTPDFFGFNKDAQLQYRGRIDSAGMDDPTGRVPEMLNAMRQVIVTGKGPEEQIASMGCSIKWSKDD